MLSAPLHAHPTPDFTLFEPMAHNVTFSLKRSTENIPPSCVYIGVEKSQAAAPPEGHKWILFWRTDQSGKDCRRIIEASWNAAGRGTVMRANKKRDELPPNLVTFCVGHLDSQDLDRLDKLTKGVVPIARSDEWVTRVVRTAAREGLLEEGSVEEGVMAALAVNW